MAQKQETFESGIKKLEAIIEDLEDENLTLDKALGQFEKGIKLMRVCENHLRNAEGKLKELLKGEDGEFVEKVLGVTLNSVVGGDDFDE
ncbi:MAG: exodeoxyribonuclease VII small subunit [bacterium]|nr:exodeoxyribonuclease VII small subunit [bacterium]